MHRKIFNQVIAAAASSALMLSAVIKPVQFGGMLPMAVVSDAADNLTVDNMPADFRTAADWIWQNRIEREQSTARRNTIFDQIVAGKGTVNYVVKWQSYRQLTYEQRQKFEKMLSDCINGWNNWLKGYENWPYEYIDVKIVGWAVIDRSCLLDLHDDEIVYTDTRFYDSQYDTSNGREEIPDKEPYAPSELSRFDHFTEPDYQYPGGLNKRFDMYMWATQGFPEIGGCGGDWGQRLSDTAYMNMIDGENIHVLEHEIGHGFGMTDFYGGEGESDGFPPGGFPGGENSLMMAGSAAKITDFDGWMLRYMWTKIKDEEGRFDIANAQPVTTATTTRTTASVTTQITTTTVTAAETPEEQQSFTDTITNIIMYYDESQTYAGQVFFDEHGAYYLKRNYSADDSTNFENYDIGDVIKIDFLYEDIFFNDRMLTNITKINNIELVQNVRETTTSTTTTQTTTTTTRTTAQTTAEETTTVTSTTLPHFSSLWDRNSIEMKVGEEYKVEMRLTNGWDFVTGFMNGMIFINTNEFDESIAKFDEKTGIITALAPGKTSISFRSYYNNDLAEFYITVFPSDNLLGDANCDGKVTIADATAVIQHLGNKDEYALSEQGELNADVVDRGDGVTGADANAVQAIEAGFIKQTEFPVAKADFDALMKSN